MDLNLAFDFDDEDFTSTRRKTDGDHLLPYNVKICTPEWFESVNSVTHTTPGECEHDNTEQLHQTLKYSADLHYRRKHFAKAAQQYETVLGLVPENNVSVRQDVYESLCRCYMYSGLTDQSLNLARELVSEMSTEDEARRRQSLILLSSMCKYSGRWAECAEALERICCLQPNFAQCFEKLGDVFMNVLDVCKENGVEVQETEDAQTHVKALTCYIRARFLCQLGLGSASQLLKERDNQFITKMTEKCLLVPLSMRLKKFATQFIPHDCEHIQQEYTKDEALTKDNAVVKDSSSEIFYRKFCSWYKAYHNQLHS